MRDDSFIVYIPRISLADFEAFQRIMRDKIAPTFERMVTRTQRTPLALVRVRQGY